MKLHCKVLKLGMGSGELWLKLWIGVGNSST